MLKKYSSRLLFASTLLMMGFAAGRLSMPAATLHAAQGGKVYELRTYTAAEGKMDAVNARFRDHTDKIFSKHGMKSIGYWTPTDPPLGGNTLIYILEHKSRDAAKASWAAFQADPEWQKAKAASEAQGRIVTKAESVFMTATDYSPMK
jgi:NIPSNAP